MGGSQSTGARAATFHLPIEITTDILLRLPAKSLFRCKSVCKSWYDLIKTPDFIATHLTQFALNPNLNSTSLLVTTYDRVTKKHAMSLIFNDGFTYGPINLDFPFLNCRKNLCIWEYTAKNYFSVAGICNGLVCINLSPFGCPLILCNPLTRQFREIPKYDWHDYNCYVKVKLVSFGFGFHPSAHDYKLIQIVVYSSSVQEVVIRADLYSMRTDSWREIDVDKVSVFFGEMNDFGGFGSFVEIPGSCASAVLNGVFYWPARVTPANEVVLMSFDMGDEVFRRIRTPVCLYWTSNETWRFTELKDKLALVIPPDNTDGCFDMWIWNEDQSFWTSQFKIESFPWIASYMQFNRSAKLTVVGSAKNGELVMTSHKCSSEIEVFSYDLKTQETRNLYYGSVPYPSDIYLYSGTLLPVM